MENKTAEKLFEAIKKDDLKAFESCNEQEYCGAFRFGRFPVLSLIYLFDSRKIRFRYEKKFATHNSWQELPEPIAAANVFRKKAGKCLRLYLNETVTPLEMLMMLDGSSRVKKLYADFRISPAVKQRLETIYSIKYARKARCFNDKIELEKRPMTRRERNRLLTCCLSVALCVVICLSTPFVVNAFSPFIVGSDGAIAVSDIEKIDFSSNKTYSLKKDVTVDEAFSFDKMNCTLLGNGRTVTIKGKITPFSVLKGTVADVVFNTEGAPVFQSVEGGATFENSTVNVNADLSVDNATAFVTKSNTGVISDVTVNVTGSLKAVASAASGVENDAELVFDCGGIAVENNKKTDSEAGLIYSGLIQNCTVNYNDFHLLGEVKANASFGGIVGVNNTYVDNCKTTGKIVSDTFDIGGVCVENNLLVRNCQNLAELSQSSSSAEWNPIVSGIAVNNSRELNGCVNSGKITAYSNSEDTVTEENSDPAAVAAGVVYLSRGANDTCILNSVNNGEISATAENRTAYCAGIGVFVFCGNQKCQNNGSVSAKAGGAYSAYGAGISVFGYGYIYASQNSGSVFAESGKEAYAGGLAAVGYAQYSFSVSKGSVRAVGNVCYAGGILAHSVILASEGVVYSVGRVENCISSCEVSANAAENNGGIAGGIIGFVEEFAVNATDETVYFGGCVTDSFFNGSVSEQNAFVGSVAGVCGKNIYETNSYPSGNELYANFSGNAACEGVGFGALVSTENETLVYIDGGNLETTIVSAEEMAQQQGYKDILSRLQ